MTSLLLLKAAAESPQALAPTSLPYKTGTSNPASELGLGIRSPQTAGYQMNPPPREEGADTAILQSCPKVVHVGSQGSLAQVSWNHHSPPLPAAQALPWLVNYGRLLSWEQQSCCAVTSAQGEASQRTKFQVRKAITHLSEVAGARAF